MHPFQVAIPPPNFLLVVSKGATTLHQLESCFFRRWTSFRFGKRKGSVSFLKVFLAVALSNVPKTEIFKTTQEMLNQASNMESYHTICCRCISVFFQKIWLRTPSKSLLAFIFRTQDKVKLLTVPTVHSWAMQNGHLTEIRRSHLEIYHHGNLRVAIPKKIRH